MEYGKQKRSWEQIQYAWLLLLKAISSPIYLQASVRYTLLVCIWLDDGLNGAY